MTDILDKARRAAGPFFNHQPADWGRGYAVLDVLGELEAQGEGGGTLAQMALPPSVIVGVRDREDATLQVQSGQIGPPLGESNVTLALQHFAEFSRQQMAAALTSLAPGKHWAAGILAFHWLSGIGTGRDIYVHGEIPMGAGQASSTAILAALARAAGFGNPQDIDPHAVASKMAMAEALAQGQTEPSSAAIIAALTSFRGPTKSPFTSLSELLRYAAPGGGPRYVGPIPLPPEVRVFALDTGVRRASARNTLLELRVAAAMGIRIIETIYRDLGQNHTPLHGQLANISPLLYRQYFRTLLPRRMRAGDFVRTFGELPPDIQNMLEPDDPARVFRVRTAVDHFVAGNEYAEQFLQAMEELADETADPAERQRTLQRAGRLLLASHHSYRLRLELSCREADWLVDALMEAGPDKGVYGARLTGTGGGGTVVALLDRSEPATDTLLAVVKSYHQLTGLTLGVTQA